MKHNKKFADLLNIQLNTTSLKIYAMYNENKNLNLLFLSTKSLIEKKVNPFLC